MKFSRILGFWLIAGIMAGLAMVPAALPGTLLLVSRITPAGNDVPAQRQIVIGFNSPVVPLGKMELSSEAVPVTVAPPVNGQWRWLDSSTLALNLETGESLKPATTYTVTVRPGKLSGTGASLSAPHVHTFTTLRPDVVHADIITWESPGTPVFRIRFNQPVAMDSAERHLFLTTRTTPKTRFPMTIIPDPDDTPNLVPPSSIREPGDHNGQPTDQPAESLPYTSVSPDPGARAIPRDLWIAFPRTALPLDTDVGLDLEPGLVSSLGPESGVTNRTLLNLTTFPELRLLGIRCQTNSDDTPMVIPAQDLPGSVRINPMGSLELVFSAPVPMDEVRGHVTITPELPASGPEDDPWANTWSDVYLGRSHIRNNAYGVRVPPRLKAWQQYTMSGLDTGIRDVFGRTLNPAPALVFTTDHRKPGYTILHPTAVLEKNQDTRMPLVVTNLDTIDIRYDRVTPQKTDTGLVWKTRGQAAMDLAYAIPLGVREMIGQGSGAVFGGIVKTRPKVDTYPEAGKFFAQVTPFQVHVKVGHFNTLVWVTDMATGKPVDQARVTLVRSPMPRMGIGSPSLAAAVTGPEGIALLPGLETLDPALDALYGWWQDDTKETLMVRIETFQDMAILPLIYPFAMDTWSLSGERFGDNTRKRFDHIRAWGTTAQGVYRTGDTIRYKLYVRNQDNRSWTLPPQGTYTLTVTDPMGKTVMEKPDLTLSAFGALDGDIRIPENGAVGWYRFTLTGSFSESSWEPMQVLVSDFTPSPFRVSCDLNGTRFSPGDTATITTSARLHSGGPYPDAGTRISANLRPGTFTSPHPLLAGFTFCETYANDPDKVLPLMEKTLNLDSGGGLTLDLALTQVPVPMGTLEVESGVQDDRGKRVSATASARFFGVDRFAGLKSRDWLYTQGAPAGFDITAVDPEGKPIPGCSLDIRVQHLETRAARVKGAGNAYLTRYSDAWIPVHQEMLSSLDGPTLFEFTPPKPGDYRVSVTVTDSRGRLHTAGITTWVTGSGGVVWHEPDNYSLTIIPETPSLDVGGTARFLVKNPFPGALALLTVERYGVLKNWTQVLDTETPVIEFPVEPDFAPGFYFSVVIVSPRVAAPLDETGVDLGKPSLRAGYARCEVADATREIQVEVIPEKPTYKPRDKVRVRLHASTPGKPKSEPLEMAVAVLDESVLDLIAKGRRHFDPGDGFNGLDGLDLANFNLLTRLVGRQVFEKKGVNAGGDGGSAAALRSIFDFVACWNPSLIPDANGDADITFTVPDNLTGWRVFAMAVTPTDRMGLGDAGFKVNRPTELRPVMPDHVMAGDTFTAGFTLMNRTDKPRTLAVTLTATGPLAQSPGTPGPPGKQPAWTTLTREVSLAPFARTLIPMPVKTLGPGILTFTAAAGDDQDRDGLVHTVPVNPVADLTTAAVTGRISQDTVTLPVVFPETMKTDTGGLRIELSPSAAGNLEPAMEAMKTYPYPCWEQQVSRAVMASHFLKLNPLLPQTLTWDDAAGFAQAVLDRAADFQTAGGGMAYYVPDDTHASPFLSAYTALAFNRLRDSGFRIPETVEHRLHDYLDTLLRHQEAMDVYSPAVTATIRAVTLAALAERGKVSPQDIQRFQPHATDMDLFGKAHFLMAALAAGSNETIVRETIRSILAHAHETGTRVAFNEAVNPDSGRIHGSSLRTGGAVLSALVRLKALPQEKDLAGDLALKLMNTLDDDGRARLPRLNTQEAVFYTNGIADFCQANENPAPDMTVTAMVDGKTVLETAFTSQASPAVVWTRPADPTMPGTRFEVTLSSQGTGSLYYTASVTYASAHSGTEPVNAGIEIRKELSLKQGSTWVGLKPPREIRKGDLLRVDLFVSLPAGRHFVVVDDPVPGGLEPVNRDLATASSLDDAPEAFTPAQGSWWFHFKDWNLYSSSRWSFYHRELRHDSVRYYSDYLAPGNYLLSYTAQAVCPGMFQVGPTKAMEMYAPDIFGKSGPSALTVLDSDSR
ncbi:MAG: alpha-2-macroglobulin family protein [Pseudomonadota bacterium]